MILQDQVSSWSEDWATAPIFRAGQEWVDGKDKTHVSDGKQPWPKSRYVKYSAQYSASMVGYEFSAVGIWFGPRSEGLVCLDIDGNLNKFLERHPSILDGAHIKSPKTDRAKVLFQVPQELWPDVKGYDNSTDTYQVLWDGKMGVCAGEYGAGGHYTFVPGDVPQAPDWMLEEMLATKQRRSKVKLNTADLRCDTVEEAENKLRDWLGVIPFEGDWLGEDLDTESWWFRVGACIAGAGIGEKGLELWTWWSQLDTRYEADWQHSDPCDERWWSLTQDGGLGPGTLCKLADQYDPERERLPEAQRAQLKRKEELEELKADNFEELIKAAKAAMELENPAYVQIALNNIAQANGFRDQGAITKILLAHEEFSSGSSSMTIAELFAQQEALEPDFVIPDLFASPSTMLFHGRGGSGKTMTAMHIAMHVARGIPYKIKGRDVPVTQGRVLWLNGDQNPSRLYRQFSEAGLLETDDIVIENHVSMLWQPWIIRKIKEHQPRLIVWDSVTSCMRGAAVDQNRAEYADPLYFLSMRNGTAFPAVGQLVIHHSNQEGGARGTTALEDAVDEVWSIRLPSKEEKEKLGNTRVIEIGKSREDNSGRRFYVSRNEDYTLKIEEASDIAETAQSSVDQLLGALRHHDDWMDWKQVEALPVSGSKAVRKANLSRLVSKGLVERKGKARSYQYRAVLARAKCEVAATKHRETHVVPGDLPLVAPLVASQPSKQEKYETQKTSSDTDVVTEDVLLKPATSENPDLDCDLPSSGSSYQTFHARDPFDSTGMTD